MNPITKIVHKLSDDDLCKAVLEIRDWHNTSILRDGIVRDVAKKICEDGRESLRYNSLRMAEDIILMVASVRYVHLYNDKYKFVSSI